jgi:hypothetical protein
VDPDLRALLLAVGAFFVIVFGVMTLVVIGQSGLDILTLTSLVIIGLVGVGLYGAFKNPPG